MFQFHQAKLEVLPCVQVELLTDGRTLVKPAVLLRFDLPNYWMRRGGNAAKQILLFFVNLAWP
jgi:hypothetical protein